MSVQIGVYQGQLVKIISSCIPDIKKNIIKSGHKTKDNMAITVESDMKKYKKKQCYSELGDFSNIYLYQSKYKKYNLISNKVSASNLSTPYERFWFSEGRIN